jgi:Tfp pilus assembly protein PilN
MRGMKLLTSINLYADRLEIQRVKRPRRRIKAAVGLALLALALVWAGLRMHVAQLEQEYTVIAALQTRLKTELGATQEATARRAAKATRRNVLVDKITRRVCGAPLLQEIFAAVPASTEFQSLRAKFDEFGGCELRITGRSAGLQPRLEADKCRLLLITSLNEANYQATGDFEALNESLATVHLGEIEATVADFTLVLKINKPKNEPRKT